MRVNAVELRKYQEKAEQYIQDLKDLGWNDPSKSTGQLVKELIDRFHIVIRTDAHTGGRDSITTFVWSSSGERVPVLSIDAKFQKSPQREMYYKKYIVHELGHFIRKHQRCRINGWERRLINAGLDDVKETVDQKVDAENEAEVLGGVVLFWPESLFRQKWEEFSHRLERVAFCFNAELDCCAKYLLLRGMLPDNHYLKYNVTRREFEDYFVPDSYDPIFLNSLSNKEYFTSRETVLGQCVRDNAVSVVSDFKEGNTIFNQQLTLHCRVYYRQKSEVPEIHEDDKIICIGNKS